MAAPISVNSFQSFGELLRFLRRRAGLSQEMLGRAVGYTGAHIGRLEQNQRLPDLDALAARFVGALLLEDEPETVARLLALAAAARGEPLPDSYRVSREELPAEPAPMAARGNLPVALTSFVGRQQELAEVRRLLAGARALTLVGAGGSGKTRLALEVAGQVAGLFPHGVWLVELAPLADPARVDDALAAVLGLATRGDQPPRSVLGAYLRARRILLVLDNCEHVLPAAAEAAEALLALCPGLTVLATSREPLRVAGEVVYRVPALSLPGRRVPSLDALSRSEAAQLFAARAAAANPRFRLTEAVAPAVAEICHRLAGLPLALELAAARVGALSVEQIAERLAAHGGLRLLTGGRRTAQARQQTLEALIDWSYVLLSAPEQALLRQLSVCGGNWPLDAAEALGGEEALEHLTRLVDKSLVAADEDEAGQVTGYHVLEPIRQFARARLEAAGEWVAAHDRHLAHFASWAEAASGHLRGPEQSQGLARMLAVHHHLRSALDWALDPRADFEAGLRLAVAVLGPFTVLSGHLREGLARAEAFLARATAEGHRPWRARLFVWAAQLAYYAGEYACGLAWGQEGAAECQRLGDTAGWAQAQLGLGMNALYAGQPALARAALEAAVAYQRAQADPYHLSLALAGLTSVYSVERDPAARATAEEALALARAAGDTWAMTNALWTLGDLLSEEGDYAAGADVFARLLPVARASGNAQTLGGVLTKLAIFHYMLDDHAAAGRYAAEALALFRDHGDLSRQPFLLRLAGYAALEAGDWSQAQALFAESLAIGRAPGRVGGLLSHGALALARGDQVRAATLGGCAEAMLGSCWTLLPPDARVLQRLRAALQPLPAWTAGRALSLEQGLELALAG